MQSLLVQAAWRLVRSSDAEDTAGSAHVGAGDYAPPRKEGRDGRPRSTPGPHPFAMWRDETEYQAKRIRATPFDPDAIDESRRQGGHVGLAQRGSSSWRSKRGWMFGRC